MAVLRPLCFALTTGSALALAALVGCGSAADDGQKRPLASLDGNLTAASDLGLDPSASNVRIAVVWYQRGDGTYRSTQDVPATPVFPSKFHIDLTDPPPASAIHTPEGAAAASAFGSIVAYEDKNGNAQLDVVGTDASSFVDRILGVNKHLYLVYVEGSLPPDVKTDSKDGSKPVPGYNLVRLKDCTGQPVLACDEDVESWLPTSTVFDLPLTANPEWATLMCADGRSAATSTGTGSSSDGGTGPLPPAPGPNGWPSKNDPQLLCAADGKSYKYERCATTSLGLCRGTNTDCNEEQWGLPSNPPPPGWPCTIP